MENENPVPQDRETNMENRSSRPYEEDEIDIGIYFAILRKVWWKIALFSLAVGALTLFYMFTQPNIFQATAVITPSIEDKKQNPTIGALASFGVSVGGPSNVEDLETLFKSNDLAVRVFRKYNLWPIVLGNKFDSATGKIRPSWVDRFVRGEAGLKSPGDWDAIRASKACLKVSSNKKAGTISVSFETPFAEGTANIVKYFLEEGKSRLQEESLDRAIRNKRFIEDQIGKTIDALTRDRLYGLYGQEVEREMLARNREQFGFRIIDSPRVPDRKIKPQRGLVAILAIFLSFFTGCVLLVFRKISDKNIFSKN